MSNLREAAQQALEAMNSFESGTNGIFAGEFEAEITALRAALEQPEQEAVAYRFQSPATEEWMLGLEPPVGSRWEIEPLYTHPPRREWRGLTEEEIISLANEPRWPVGNSYVVPFARDIEAALKEKNHE
jgi:hypothetical protein